MSTKLNTFHYQIPTNIIFGADTIKELPNLAQRFSKKVLVLYMKDIPCVKGIINDLCEKGFLVTEFYNISPNPFTNEVEDAVGLAKKANCELIVAIGGGSVIDTAKAVSILMTNEGKTWDYTIEMGDERRKVINNPIPLIAVPTTAGTGAEVSQNAIITHPKTKNKGPIRSVESCPKYAIIDPKLHLSMPKHLTIATGFDAFTHAFEKFLGQEYFSYIDAISFDAMKNVVNNLEKVVSNPEDIDARGEMAWASTQAALCVLAESYESGLHVFSLPLSGLFKVPHGEALALVMPFVIQELIKIRPDRVSKLLNVFVPEIEVFKLNEKERCTRCVKEIESWLKRLGLNRQLSDYGIAESDLEKCSFITNKPRLLAAWGRDVSNDDVQNFLRLVL